MQPTVACAFWNFLNSLDACGVIGGIWCNVPEHGPEAPTTFERIPEKLFDGELFAAKKTKEKYSLASGRPDNTSSHKMPDLLHFCLT
jgi:hypothetical protein